MAGTLDMEWKKFLIANVLGAAAWVYGHFVPGIRFRERVHHAAALFQDRRMGHERGPFSPRISPLEAAEKKFKARLRANS